MLLGGVTPEPEEAYQAERPLLSGLQGKRRAPGQLRLEYHQACSVCSDEEWERRTSDA